MALFLGHFVVLAYASMACASRLVRNPFDRVLATALVAWGNLVSVSLLLSLLGKLGEPAWYFRCSLLAALVTFVLIRRLTPAEPAALDPSTATPAEKPRRLLIGFLAISLALISYANIRIAAAYPPNNYDSLTYHLPRTMFYLGQNSLAHFDTGNARQIFFPFNFNLLQLFCFIYGPPLQVVSFLNIATWALSGLAIYRLARLCGCSLNSALVASWLGLTSTQILAQATATTNDLPTAAGLLCSLVFAMRWRQSGLARDALLAGLAAGLTAGSKLTVIFFGPAAGLIALAIGYQHWRRADLARFAGGIRAWIAPAVLAFVVSAPFAVINLAEKGQWINKNYDYTLNQPFSFACAAQTAKTYLVQLFVEPLHRFTFDLRFTTPLNEWFSQHLFKDWNPAYAFSPLYIFPPDINEDHVWFGFAGPLIFVCAIICLWRGRQLHHPTAWLALIGLGWFAAYFFLNKWSLYNQRYFVPAILVMSPCVAALLDASQPNTLARRFLQTVLFLVAFSSLWLAAVYLFNNVNRPFAPLFRGDPGPLVPAALPAVPPLMVQRLSDQPRINIDSYLGNERIFLLMGLGSHQRFTAREGIDPDQYNVISHRGFPRYVARSDHEGIPSYIMVPVPTKRTAGVEFLGTIEAVPIDYFGLVPHANDTAPAADDRNVFVTLVYGPHEPGGYAQTRIKVAGLNPNDRARLAVSVENADGSPTELASFSETGETTVTINRPFRRITLKVNDADTSAEIGAAEIPYLREAPRPTVPDASTPVPFITSELIATDPNPSIAFTGLATPEGPYQQWDLPLFRWAKQPTVRLAIPASDKLKRLRLSYSLRLQYRTDGHLEVLHNGKRVQEFWLHGADRWYDKTVEITPAPGVNILELRDVPLNTGPDWIAYLNQNPDIKASATAQGQSLEEVAQQHYELKGREEGRVLPVFPSTENAGPPTGEVLYFTYRSLRIEGFPDK